MSKRKVWAPLVISQSFVNSFSESLQGDIIIERIAHDDGSYSVVEKRDPNSYNAVFLTEEDLVTKTNSKLEDAWLSEFTVSYRTFQRYKARILAWINKKENGEQGLEKELDGESLENMQELWRLIKKHLTEQKERLFSSMLNSPSNMWQKYARILERKFDSWNIKQKTEDVNETKRLDLASLNAKAKALTTESTIAPPKALNDA